MTKHSLPFIFGIFFSFASAQESSPTPPPTTLDQKAARYYELLQKKPENAPVLQRFIDAWLENGDQKQLLTILREKAKAGTANEWRILAAASEYLGDDASALAALNEAIKIIPDDAATRIARATLAAKMQNFNVAIADLELAMKNEALLLTAATLRGKLLAQTGRVEEAVKTWNDLIAKFPADIGLQEDLLDLLIQENLLDQALTSSRQLIEKTKDPYQKAMRRLRTAEILSLSGKKVEASEEYLAILELSAQDSWLERETIALAEKLHSAEDDPTAWKKFLDSAIAAAPTRNALQQQLAAYFQLSGQQNEAQKIHESLVAKNPGSRPMREGLIAFLLQTQQSAKAIEHIRHLLKANPNDAPLWEQLATLHRDLKQTDEMNQALAKAAELLPADEAGSIQSAQLYQRFEQENTTETKLREAAKKFGPTSDAADTLAQYLFSKGKNDEAMEIWKQAAIAADREGLLRLARTLTAIGKHQQSADFILSRLKDFPDDALLLSTLCQSAPLLENAQALLPQALQLVRLAKSTTDLETAINSASAIISRSDISAKTIEDLVALQQPTMGESCLLAQLYELLGDSINANRTLDAAAERDQTLTVPLRRISLLTLRGDLDGAIAAWRKLVTLPGGNKPQHWKELAALIRRNGDLNEAVQAIQQWKSVAPGDKATYQTLAEIYQEMGDPEKAVAEIRRMIAKFGADAENRGKLIDVLNETGLHAEALRLALLLYDEAESASEKLKQCPRIATAAQADGREKEIDEMFQKRARENTTSTTALIALQEMRQAWQVSSYRYSDERLDFTPLVEAMRRKPNDKGLILDVADRYQSSGMTEKSEPLYRKVEQMNPTDDELRRIAGFYRAIGEVERSEEITKNIKAAPQNIQESENAVFSQIMQGNAAEALVLLDPLQKAHPLDWRFTYLRGLALLRQKQFSEAANVFLQVSTVQDELKRITPVNNMLSRYNSYQSMRGNTSNMNAEELFGTCYQLTIGLMQSMDAMAKQISSRGNYGNPYVMRSGMYGMGGSEALPENAQQARFCAIHFLLYIAANAPEKEALALLPKINAPSLPFLSAIKTDIEISDPAKFVTLALEKKTDISLLKMAMSESFGNYKQANLESRNSRRYRNTEKESEIVNEETAKKLRTLLAEVSPEEAIEYTGYYATQSEVETLKDKEFDDIKFLLDLLPKCKAEVRKNWIVLLTTIKAKLPQSPKLAALMPQLDSLLKTLQAENPDLAKKNPEYRLYLLNQAITSGNFAQAGELMSLHLDSLFLPLQDDDRSPYSYYARQSAQPISALRNTESLPGASSFNLQNDEFSAFMQTEGGMPNEKLLFEKFGYDDFIRYTMYGGCDFLRAYMDRSDDSRPSLAPELEALIKDLKISDQPDTEKVAKPLSFKPEQGAGIVKALATCKYPIFRCIILRELGYKEEYQKALDAIMAADSTAGAESLLWAATQLAEQKGDPTKIYQLCLRARENNLPRIHNDLADAMLMAAALALPKEQKSTLDLTSVQSSALRVTKKITFNRGDDQAKDYAKVLASLGLNDAGKRLAQKAATQRNRNSSSPYQQVQSAQTKIAKLIASNQREAAARMVYQLKTTTSTSGYNMEDEFAEILTGAKLQKEYIAIATPPATASYTRRKNACLQIIKLLGIDSQKETLEKLYAENPEDLEVLVSYISVKPEAEAAVLIKKIIQKPEFRIEQFTQNFAQQLNSFVQGGSTTVDTYKIALGNYRLMAAFLKALPQGAEIDKGSQTYFMSAISRLQQRSYISGAFDNMPAWGVALSSSRSSNEKKVILDLIKERENIMEQLVQGCLIHPIFMSTALAIIQQATPEWRGKFQNTDQPIVQSLIAQGMEAFKTKSDDSSDEEEDDYDPFASRLRYNSSDDVSVDPQNVALDLALTRGGESTKIAAAVEAALPAEIMAKHQAICQMLRQPKADALTTFLKDEPSKNAACVQFSLKMLQLRGDDITPCLTALLQHKDFLEIKDKEQQSLQVGSQSWPFYELLAGVLRYCMTPSQSARHEEFLKIYTTTLLGHEKHWAAYAKLPNNYSDNTLSTVAYRKNLLGASLQPFSRTNDRAKLPTAVSTLRFLWKNNLADNNQSSEEVEFATSGDAKKDRENILSLVANLKAAGLFRMGSGMFRNSQRTHEFLPTKFLPDLSDNSNTNIAMRKILFDELLKLTGDDALYAGLAALAYGGKFEQDAQPRLVAHLALIKKWSETEQKTFLLWLNQQNHKPKDPALLAWMKNAGSGSFTELEKELRTLAASSGSYEIWDEDDVAQLLRNMISMDAAKTGKIWGEILNSDIANPLPKNSGRSYSMNGINLSPIQYAHLELVRSYSNDYSSPTIEECYLFSDFLSALPKINWTDAYVKFFGTYSLPDLFGISLSQENRTAIHPQIKTDAVLKMMLFHKKIDEAKLLQFPDLLRGYLYNLSYPVNHKEIPMMEKWYADQFKNQNTLSAKIAKLSLLLFQRSATDAKVRTEKSLEFDQIFTQLMQDPRITPVAKCCLYAKQYSNLTPNYDFASISANLVESLQNDTKNPSRVFYEVIDSLTKRPHPAANMQAICEMLKNEMDTLIESYEENENSATYFIKTSLAPIALANKHKGLLDTILNHEQADMNGDVELIAKLIAHGFTDLALRVVPKPNAPSVIPQYMLMQYPDLKTRTAYYSSFLEKQLPKFLAAIPDPGQRFRMECLLSALHDADKSKPSENWDARINRMAKSFAKNAPTEKQSRKELLAVLGVTGAAENRDEYMRAIGANTIGENMALWHTLRQASQSTASILPQNCIIYATMHADLNRGDTDLVFKNLSSLVHYAKNSSEERLCMEAYQTVIKTFTLSIPLAMLGMPAEKQEQVLQELLKHAQLVSTKQFYNTADGHRLRLLLLWAHAVSGKGADFVKNYATLDKDYQAKHPAIANSEFNKNNWRQYCHYHLRWLRVDTPELMKLNKERLSGLFKAVLQSKEICEAEIFIPNDLNFYIEAKYLSWDELNAVISALPDDNPNKPLFLCQMACNKLIREKQSPAVDELYDKAVKLAQDQNNPLTNEIIAMYGMELHSRNRNKEQGMKIIEGIDPATIRDRRKQLKGFINQMKQPAKK